MKDEVREAFELFESDRNMIGKHALHKTEHGDYEDPDVHNRWVGFSAGYCQAGRADAGRWRAISEAPDSCIVAHFVGDKLYWVEAANRGKPPLQKFWYTPFGRMVTAPTHFLLLPEAP